ncbi:hypothetical protein E3U55_09995 [Filobacillus milosensis]|uniref:Uncharacterized protein n=1 Tax=Filobacillus milosensis TaxID=94137 RepID=A0A4Y8IRU3_9BACI|nr:hypothetical protein [Filobacillus milosensis]TFB21140.1 hypothetical protein E3U55_09995 [Filobacillus milosensis]
MYFVYSDYKKHQRYESYISNQIRQSLGSVVDTMSHRNKTSDQALATILENKSISMEEVNHIGSVLSFYFQKLQATGDVTNHLEMKSNHDLSIYISSCHDKLIQYERQLEKSENTKLELNSSELKFFEQMKSMTSEWENVSNDYKEVPETELYKLSEGHWISLYNDLSIVTKENLN